MDARTLRLASRIVSREMIRMAATAKAEFGKSDGYGYAIKIDGIPSGYIRLPFGRKIDYNHTLADFKKTAKHYWVGAKGKATLAAVKRWVRETKPKQFYAAWKEDNSMYKDDSVEVFYK